MAAMLVDSDGRMYWSDLEPVDFEDNGWQPPGRAFDDETDCFVLNVPGLDQALRMHIVKGNLAGGVYKGGLFMLEHLDVSLLQNKNIIELGCGTGFLSIACDLLLSQQCRDAKPGEMDHHIVATDIGCVLDAIRDNVNLNGATHVGVHELEWGVTDVQLFKSPDVVIMADCAYGKDRAAHLANVLATLCGPGTVVLHAFQQRPTISFFFDELRLRGFVAEEIARDQDVMYFKHYVQ